MDQEHPIDTDANKSEANQTENLISFFNRWDFVVGLIPPTIMFVEWLLCKFLLIIITPRSVSVLAVFTGPWFPDCILKLCCLYFCWWKKFQILSIGETLSIRLFFMKNLFVLHWTEYLQIFMVFEFVLYCQCVNLSSMVRLQYLWMSQVYIFLMLSSILLTLYCNEFIKNRFNFETKNSIFITFWPECKMRTGLFVVILILQGSLALNIHG